MIRPRLVDGAVLARVAGGEVGVAAEELGREAPARTTALMLPPWAPMPGTRIGMSPTIARTRASSSGYVAPTTSAHSPIVRHFVAAVRATRK